MAIFDFLERPLFSSRHKFKLHLTQFVLVSIAVGLSVPRLFAKGQPRTRSSTIALGMGAKSIIILIYLLLSEHSPRFQRWHSYKLHAIISCMEILFWAGVAGLTFKGNLGICNGVWCGLSWSVVVVAAIIVNTEIFTSLICIRELREYRGGKIGKIGSTSPTPPPPQRTRHYDEEYGARMTTPHASYEL